jgi:hypothetical protein
MNQRWLIGCVVLFSILLVLLMLLVVVQGEIPFKSERVVENHYQTIENTYNNTIIKVEKENLTPTADCVKISSVGSDSFSLECVKK